ncbi:MAG TPA: FG-GAP-like repeat-containing protein [Thermoanaerobaculia bacterium]|nr:FG-GAP-like repeat-containing protein [Thermoanaerobaculia bacterium]
MHDQISRAAAAVAVALMLFFVSPVAAQVPVPTVTSIYPTGGPTAGGTFVTIHGANFQPGVTVSVGGALLTNVVRVNSGTITGITSARTAGTANMWVTNPNAPQVRLFKAFAYTDITCCTYPSFVTTALSEASVQTPVSVTSGLFFGNVGNTFAASASDKFSLFVGDAAGTGGFAAAQGFTSPGNVTATTTLDINGDGIEDLALAVVGGPVKTYLGDATTPFHDTRITPTDAVAFALASGDFNEDGVAELVIPDHLTGYVNICFGNLGGGGCAATFTYSVGTTASGVAVGDFNNDGHLDIAASDDTAGTVSIFLGNGTGYFSVGDPIDACTSTTDVMGLAAGYLDDDALLDLAVATGAILFGNGDGTFTAGTPLPATDGRHVVISDFNRDGHRDIAIDTSLTAVHIALGDGSRDFYLGPVITATPGQYDGFSLTDNADGQVDLVIGGHPVVARNTITTCPTITVSPSSITAGTTFASYNRTFSQSGGAGAITYSISGALPAGVSFVSGSLIGTPTETGSFPITVTARDANGCTGSHAYTISITADRPTHVVATATTLGSVNVSWIGVTGADYYQVWRKSNTDNWTQVGAPIGTSMTDTVTSGKAYLYRVNSVDGAQNSPDSLPDFTTTVAFTDDPLTSSNVPRAVHITELRSAVNLIRLAAGLSSYSFTDSNLTGLAVKAVHVQQLRDAIDAARVNVGLTALTYTNTIAVGARIRASDINETRTAVK